MKIPEGCMKQIDDALFRAANGRQPTPSQKWKAFLQWKNNKYYIVLYHYQHLVWIYNVSGREEIHSWWEKPADKRGLDSARIWIKAYHEHSDSIGKPLEKRVKCEVCQGTGESDYGPELWQVHPCGKCNGAGYYERSDNNGRQFT